MIPAAPFIAALKELELCPACRAKRRWYNENASPAFDRAAIATFDCNASIKVTAKTPEFKVVVGCPRFLEIKLGILNTNVAYRYERDEEERQPRTIAVPGRAA